MTGSFFFFETRLIYFDFQKQQSRSKYFMKTFTAVLSLFSLGFPGTPIKILENFREASLTQSILSKLAYALNLYLEQKQTSILNF